MDHRVSKDMISSGMSYSGNQSKEDLGRTQYGSVARPDVLMNAYQSMYSQDTDQLNEGVRDLDPEKGTKERKARLEKKRGMNLDDHPQYKKEEVKEAKVDKKLPDYKRSAARTERYGNPYGSVGSGPQRDRRADHEARRGVKKENSDFFDIIKGHLLDEGYADTEQAALVIMANMSEEWKQSIVEMALTPEQESRRRDLSKAINKAGTPGYPGVNDPATRKMQGEFIRLQQLKGV